MLVYTFCRKKGAHFLQYHKIYFLYVWKIISNKFLLSISSSLNEPKTCDKCFAEIAKIFNFKSDKERYLTPTIKKLWSSMKNHFKWDLKFLEKIIRMWQLAWTTLLQYTIILGTIKRSGVPWKITSNEN